MAVFDPLAGFPITVRCRLFPSVFDDSKDGTTMETHISGVSDWAHLILRRRVQ
jgi:hypothetical protein